MDWLGYWQMRENVDILYGKGIERTCELIEMAVDKGIIDKAGAWYSYQGEKIGQGKDRVKTYLEENNEVLIEIETKINEMN